MLGIEDYGSDSDSSQPSSPKRASLPSLSQPSKAPPKTTKFQRAPKKITIALPALPSSKEDEDESQESERPAKKRKTGAGASSLLSMLPVPKQSNPTPQLQRVLGGGSGPGLNFHTQSLTQDTNSGSSEWNVESDSSYAVEGLSKFQSHEASASSATLFRPTSLVKGKKNISVEESNINQNPRPQKPTLSAPSVDFFSLGSTKTTVQTSQSSTSNSLSSSSFLAPSSAPTLPTTFQPPEPTPTDPYPGYYQLPSGAWAAYDTEYYGKFMKKWEKEYNAHVRALEKGTIKGFEGLQDASVEEIDAMKEMEKAKKEIQEREEKKAVAMGAGGAPAAPKMNINASKMSGVARSRHQLSTLLKEAYENREALEEQIAQGKRNRKEAGNKYGF